jgi:transcriptional regulator of acetoin/glycerol metabolism
MMPSKHRSPGPVDLSDAADRAVNLAWERHQTGALDQGDPHVGVRSAIHQSWLRSTSAGIDIQSEGAPSADGWSDVDRLRQANRELCRAARGSLEKIGRMLLGTEAMLILTDGQGLGVEAIARPCARAARSISMSAGCGTSMRSAPTASAPRCGRASRCSCTAPSTMSSA